MGAGLFWGILLVLVGISLIFKVVLKVDFPVFKILFAFFFIFIGIKILVGGKPWLFQFERDKNDIIFSEGYFEESEDISPEYNVIFGKGNFDFRNTRFQEEKFKNIKVNTVFGGSEILLSKRIPVRIKVEAVFAGSELPNGNSTVLGSTYYESDNYDETEPHLYLEADVVFGNLVIKYK